MSILLGLGLSSLFRARCTKGGCKALRSPPLAKVAQTVYRYGKQCVQFDPVPHACGADGDFYPAGEAI